jgi:hypothetical protein
MPFGGCLGGVAAGVSGGTAQPEAGLTLMMTPKLGKRKSGVTELCSGDVTAGEEPEVLTTTGRLCHRSGMAGLQKSGHGGPLSIIEPDDDDS